MYDHNVWISLIEGINMKIQIKEGLGGRIRLMIAGAAPLPGQIEEFMRVTSCSIVVQGYGKSLMRILPSLTSVLWIKVHTNSSSAEISWVS